LALLEQHRDEDLLLICDYLEKTSGLTERELAKLIATARAPPPTSAIADGN
jgi:hypothetical protein